MPKTKTKLHQLKNGHKKSSTGNAITVGGHGIPPGARKTIDILAGKLYTHEPVYMPIHVVNGKQAGPRLFICAAIHGDEINGIEIVRRVLEHRGLSRLKGTLIAVPVVNVLGVFHQSRYLPDRRDLNRAFPGLKRGSLASRMAHLFMKEVVAHADYGIDIHTGANHRDNWPQVRIDLDNKEHRRLATAFGAPVAIDASYRKGSLREAAMRKKIPTLVYEGGEALRFDEFSIKTGVNGVLNVIRELDMLSGKKLEPKKPYVVKTSRWVRAPASGIFRSQINLGEKVKKGTVLGFVADPFGEDQLQVKAPTSGIVIGHTQLPLVHEGEALYHIGKPTKTKTDKKVEELGPQDLSE
ncbi:MAG: succinylglutamate desuccinylase [Gammaproteobacteria bacterium]|nr:succinylglutamate desuccinylase [Gammaproteobacteria bacterium]